MFFLSILESSFLFHALVAMLALSLIAPSIGLFLVVRRASSLADTLSHVSFAGVSFGLLFSISSLWTSFIACILSIFAMERLRKTKILSFDVLTTLFLFSGLAFGMLFASLSSKNALSLTSILFGSILTISLFDVLLIVSLSFFGFLILRLFQSSFFSLCADEDLSKVNGISTVWFSHLLSFLSASVIAVAIPLVGVLLIGAIMILPVLFALQWELGFYKTWMLAIFCAFFSSLVGLYLSFTFPIPVSSAMVLCMLSTFLIALTFRYIKNTHVHKLSV